MSNNHAHSHSAGSHKCNNCGEEALRSAAEKKARLSRNRGGAGGKAEEPNHGKVALKTKVIGGGKLSKEDAVGESGGGVAGRAPSTKVVSFSVKSNLGKVRIGASVPRGHYLYGRKGGGGSGHRPPVKASPRVEVTPRPSTVTCDLIITSPRKAQPKSPRQGAKSSEGQKESENLEKGEEEQEYLPDEDLFIPAKSIVNPNDLNNDDLRFLFKYGVRLPVLSANAAGGTKHGQLALVHLDDDCPPPPPTPPPASVDEHYLIHKHFLSQLPESHLLYNDQDIELNSLCDPISQETVISEISLGPEKPSSHSHHPPPGPNMSTSGALRDSTGGTGGMGRGRAMTSHSGGSQSSVLSKLTAYSWRRQEDDKKLPQVTDDLFYRATHASVEARAHFNKSNGSSNRFGLTKAVMANCGFCQKTRNASDSEDETSSLGSGAFRTRQLVRRINELEGLQQSPSKSMGNVRSAKAGIGTRSHLIQPEKKSKVAGSVDSILYNQVRQSIDWLNVPRDTQSHIAIMGRCLSPSRSGSKPARLTRALMEGRDHKSAQTYLDYVENVRNTLRQTSKQSKLSGSTGSNKSSGSAKTSGNRRHGTMQDAVESVFACNRPMSRPVEYEEQELSASFVDDASGVDIAGHSKRPTEEDPLLVNGVTLESRPPPNSPRDGAEQGGFDSMHSVGRRSTLRVDLRRATQVS